MTDSDRPEAGHHEEQPTRRPFSSPWWRLAVAVAAVGGLTWGVTATDASVHLTGDPRDDAAAATAGPGAGTFVESAVLACPGPVPWLSGAEQDRPRVEVLAAGAPHAVLDAVPPSPVDATGATADDGSGAAPADEPSLLGTTEEDGPSVELQHGIPAWFDVDEPVAALAEATGTLAPGVAGGQLGLSTEAGSRGLTVSGCVAPEEVQWLLGGGSAPGRSEQLVLTNPGPDAITVDVSVWGADGPVETTGGSGIVVPGRGQAVQLLDALAPSTDAPVVAVAATGGAVVAYLAESFREGTTDRGTEVVPPVAAPATDLVVPALPAPPEGHVSQVVLRVAAPGDAQAVVDITALTADGAVRLTDRVTRVAGGHTVDVELDDLPEGATALRLRSDEPVTAGARLEVLPAEAEPEVVEEGASTLDAAAPDEATATAGPGTDEATTTAGPGADVTDQVEPLLRAAGDIAWVGATVPTSTPTGMALSFRGSVPGGSAALALSAVDGTTARVTWVDMDGQASSEEVELSNDTTVLVDVPDEARAVWVVGAGAAGVSSALHVAGADERGPFVAATTVPGLPWLRQVTQVLPTVP